MSGNGVDLGSVYGLLLEVAAAVNRHDRRFDELEARMATKDDLASLKAEMDRRFAAMDQRFVELRQEVADYHAAVVGHGIHISDHEDRIGRLERHTG